MTIPRLAARALKLRPTGHRSAYREVLRCGAPAGRLGVSRLTVTAMHHDHDASADQFHGSSNTLSVSSSLPHWAPGPSESDLLALGRFSLESSLMVLGFGREKKPTRSSLASSATRLTRPQTLMLVSTSASLDDFCCSRSIQIGCGWQLVTSDLISSRSTWVSGFIC